MLKKINLILICIALINIVIYSTQNELIDLSQEERNYLDSLGKIEMCVDPDWMPYEFIDEQGNYIGIGADLVKLVEQRLNIKLELITTKNWGESLAYSKQGKCLILPFLNQTKERDEWLNFTEPMFTDPFVFISREEFPFITSPQELTEKTIALPVGTSTEEIIKNNFPNFKIIHVNSELEAFKLVSNKKADLTIRPLIVAAYTIRKEGLFNLKIAGQFPDNNYQLRIGVISKEVKLRDILNKAVLSLTQEEKDHIVNDHVYVKYETPFDYTQVIMIVVILLLIIIIGYYRNFKLKKSYEERSLLLDNIQIQVWYMVNESAFGLVNKAYSKFIGKKVSEVSFKRLNDILSNEDASIHKEKNIEVFKSKKEMIFEEWFTDAKGEKRLLKIHKSPKINSKGNVEYLICSAEDITERKENELRIKNYIDQLENLNEELKISQKEIELSLIEKSKLVDELKLLNTEKDKFFAIIAHDLKSPFQAFLGLTEIMINDLDDLTSKELFDYSREINLTANKLYTLLKNLLDWARMQQESTSFEQKPVLLDKIINNVIEIAELNFSAKEIIINKSIDDRLIVNADENMISSVIQNFISNSIKFTPNNGEINISAFRENENLVKVQIRDSGIGMDQKMLDKLFKIDQKVNRPGTNGEKSTGLGLLLCKEFINKHKGEITVESEVGKGTLFSFTLPIE